MDDLEKYQAAILCGGRGTRLRPTTDVVPKALVKLNGRPILDYIVDYYHSKGLREFILCIGYKGHQVEEHCANYASDLDFRFSDAGESASMLQRLWAIKDLISEQVFVSYCDTFIDLDIGQMLEEHVAKGAGATMVSAPVKSPLGLLNYDDSGWVDSFIEKPILKYYFGSFILERTALEHVTEEMLAKPDGEGIVEFFQRLTALRLLAAHEYSGAPITFNTESERQNAEEVWGNYYTYTEDE